MNQDQALELAKLLTEARQRLKLSLYEVGLRSNVSDTTVMRLEQAAKLNPRPETLRSVAETLSLDLADIFAVAGYAQPASLPSFRPYLRTKYGDMPEAAARELEDYFTQLARKHGIDTGTPSGPAPGEDEI